jgi:hypothetical protein
MNPGPPVTHTDYDPDRVRPIHDGSEYVDVPADPEPIDLVNAAAVLMARAMNRYWDVCQRERRPVAQWVRFRVEPGRVVCEAKFW